MAAKGFLEDNRPGYAPLLPGAADDFLAGGRPGAALPGGESMIWGSAVVEKPAQAVAAKVVVIAGADVLVVALPENHVADRRIALVPASGFGLGFRYLLPVGRRGESCPGNRPLSSIAPGFGILPDVSN